MRADINADGSEIPSVFTIIEIELKVVGYKQSRFNLYKLYFCKQVLTFEFETENGQNFVVLIILNLLVKPKNLSAFKVMAFSRA